MAEPPDWESAAGGEPVSPRLLPGAYVYHGDGNLHWLAQPCNVLESDNPSIADVTVVFACGCRADVPRNRLVRPTA